MKTSDNRKVLMDIDWEAYLKNIILEYEWFRRIPAHILSKRLKVPYDEIKKGIWMGKFEAEIKRISEKLEKK